MWPFKSKKQKEELEQKKQTELKELFKASIKEDREKRYNSNEPFVEVISSHFDEEQGIQLRLDWNPAFIKYLKKHGVPGHNEDEIVACWLRGLGRDSVNIPDSETFT